MQSTDKASFQRRRLLESRDIDKKSEKKKSTILKFLLILKGKFKSTENNESPSKKPFFHSRKRIAIAAVIFLIVLVGGGGFGWYEWYQYQLSQNPAVIYAKKLKSLTDMVGQQVILPKGEQPVIATVSDITKLPHQTFFKEAENGDKILMYKKHKEAFLYRPSTGQVITEAQLDFENVQSPSTQRHAVAGASTSAVVIGVTPAASSSSSPASYIPQGKILIQPQQ